MCLRALTCLIFAASLGVSACVAQKAAATTTNTVKKPLTLEEKELFLQHGVLGAVKQLGEGSTKAYRATLTDQGLAHDVQIQPIDVYKPVWKGVNGTVEKNFRDTYKFNIAAYRMAKLLGLGEMVPPSIERDYNGKLAAWTWWEDDVQMTEEQRRVKKIPAPADQGWVNQLNVVKVFDQLIANIDRNQGNLLITSEWKLRMIDHTRSFRTNHELQRPEILTRVDHKLFARLKGLQRNEVAQAAGPYLRPEEVDALMARRDAIVRHFQTAISQKGDFAVLTDMPRSTPAVSVP